MNGVFVRKGRFGGGRGPMCLLLWALSSFWASFWVIWHFHWFSFHFSSVVLVCVDDYVGSSLQTKCLQFPTKQCLRVPSNDAKFSYHLTPFFYGVYIHSQIIHFRTLSALLGQSPSVIQLHHSHLIIPCLPFTSTPPFIHFINSPSQIIHIAFLFP